MRALASEEHVLDDVEVVGERKVLVDGLDAELGRVARRADASRMSVPQDLAPIRRVDTGHRADQDRLAGTVVTDERGDLARRDLEVDPGERVHRSEALVESSQFE